jgi:hypothetical protein
MQKHMTYSSPQDGKSAGNADRTMRTVCITSSDVDTVQAVRVRRLMQHPSIIIPVTLRSTGSYSLMKDANGCYRGLYDISSLLGTNSQREITLSSQSMQRRLQGLI